MYGKIEIKYSHCYTDIMRNIIGCKVDIVGCYCKSTTGTTVILHDVHSDIQLDYSGELESILHSSRSVSVYPVSKSDRVGLSQCMASYLASSLTECPDCYTLMESRLLKAGDRRQGSRVSFLDNIKYGQPTFYKKLQWNGGFGNALKLHCDSLYPVLMDTISDLSRTRPGFRQFVFEPKMYEPEAYTVTGQSEFELLYSKLAESHASISKSTNDLVTVLNTNLADAATMFTRLDLQGFSSNIEMAKASVESLAEIIKGLRDGNVMIDYSNISDKINTLCNVFDVEQIDIPDTSFSSAAIIYNIDQPESVHIPIANETTIIIPIECPNLESLGTGVLKQASWFIDSHQDYRTTYRKLAFAIASELSVRDYKSRIRDQK